MSSSRTPVAIIGASGYTGAELVRILVGHPHVTIAAIYARRAAGQRLAEVFPQFTGRVDLPIEAFDADAVAARAQVAFSALPHGDSAEVVAALRARGVTTLDLSADFRLHDLAAWRAWYGDGHAHPAAELLGAAIYGSPERHRAALRGAGLIAVPGCFPTSAILAIAPLLERGLVRAAGIVVDAKSGASGAGRSPAQATHLPEAGEGVRAYKVAGAHRHTPEIEQELGLAAARAPGAIPGPAAPVLFTPHLLPMSRGIFTCVYAQPTDPTRPASAYRDALALAYRDEPFVDVLAPGKVPDTAHVRGSNRAHVTAVFEPRTGTVLAMSAIDNLVKGAAGQAVQCLNIARGWDERAGLDQIALFP
jgi:N-acetyl-gamma-glutamyl-phosphate reductase